MKFMLDNFHDNEKEQLRQDDNKREKEKSTNLDSDEKKPLWKSDKKGKKLMRDSVNDNE